MRHVVLYVFSFTCFGIGAGLIVANLHQPTVHILIFGAGLLAASALFAIPADFKTALATLAPYVPLLHRGGN